MAKRNKNKRTPHAGSTLKPSAKRSVSPTLFCITISVHPTDDDIIESKMVSIKFPCSLAEFAWHLANCSFVLAQELAEKHGIKFEPSQELIP